ncbi:uncharacterized protein B0T23DRAFT_120466 [Neurospora hispaniola]|uniref:Uncharacterized protein n=1 Tax=Neurospora hispaniola TaxID=588809 RepID=A0AAJ0MT05_9PEZI|nr:hypothetical protein B0T23DRAFT_120466 [Neurospora hispaniola]
MCASARPLLITCLSRCNGLACRPPVVWKLFGALEGRPHLAAQSRIPAPLRWMPVSFATVPSRIWMPATFSPFSLYLPVSVRMNRPFPETSARSKDYQHSTPYPDNPPRTRPRTGLPPVTSVSSPEAVIISLNFVSRP